MQSQLWQALQGELHIPQDRDIFLFAQWWPLARKDKNGKLKGQWKGFYIDVVGTFAHADDPPQAPLFWLHSPPDRDQQGYTARTEDRYYGMPTTPLIAWRRRVVYQQSPPWLEACWHPETGVRLDVCGVEALSPTQVAEFYAKSRGLLQQVSRRGRPPGLAYFVNAEDFQARLIHIMQRVIREGRSPTQERVAKYFDVRTSDRQLREWLNHFGLRWQDLLQRARSPEIPS